MGSGKFLYARDPEFDVINNFERAEFEERMGELSTMLDTLDPDLSAFQKHGGKLVVLDSTNDYAQSPVMGMEYYDSVVSRLGQNHGR